MYSRNVCSNSFGPPTLVDASVDYMRSSSSDSSSSGSNELDAIWASESSQRLLASDSPISSPSPSCTRSCIFEDARPEDKDVTEDDYQSSRVEVPYSSSPPDFATSSHSNDSYNSQSRSSDILRSNSAGSRSDDDSVLVPQSDILLSDPHSDTSDDAFGRKLHQLLLAVMREQGQERRTADPRPTPVENHSSRISTSSVNTPDLPGNLSSGHRFAENITQDEIASGSPLSTTTLEDRSPAQSPLSTAPNNDFLRCKSAYTDFMLPQSVPDELSPIKFEVPQELRAENLDQLINFRVIKRARSYALLKEQEQSSGPAKRQKTCKNLSAHANERIYAHRTASLRRAESLRVPEGPGRKVRYVFALYKPSKHLLQTNVKLVPTVPASPAPQLGGPRHGHRKNSSHKVLLSPVPIIAPPLNHAAKLPLSIESLAKRRLISFLWREAGTRDWDGLPSGICQGPPNERLSAMVGDTTCDDEEDDYEQQVKFEWEAVLGLEAKTREAVIAWLLKVLPERRLNFINVTRSPSPSSNSTCSQSSNSSYDSPYDSDCTGHTDCTGSKYEPGRNLLDQLQNSPETRFHAIWMFLRYFYLATPHGQPDSNPWAMTILRNGNFLHNVWTIAVACLAISVKVCPSHPGLQILSELHLQFHRDFLEPLIPVFAKEYLSLAPYSLTHERLETAQRDILSLFDWRLGVTPQPVMDELWLALPSLRNLLDF
ncbi:hypothetical protein CPB84DRAFT_579837 [Gymnopilus junonius]|uniref:Uncharacterized protein n=1 Tax=Gymnopilus junonius TaxID=109634 RepID=A0A9P5N8G1_GYMJU|nr:hypothetical protein CPB84DRAFT_579837 [Gymnopilus junonius]